MNTPEPFQKGDRVKVFISYARQDGEFLEKLLESLGNSQFQVIVDLKAISEGETWEERLAFLIREADVFVFVMSEAWLSSSICNWELEEARRCGKRIIGTTIAPIRSIPKQHQTTDFIFLFSDPKITGSGFESGLARLITGLNEDRGWWRKHTYLEKRHASWTEHSQLDSLLLSGDELEEMNAWLAERPRDAPRLPRRLIDFIAASSQSAGITDSAKKQSTIRVLGVLLATIAIICIFLLITVALQADIFHIL